MNRNSLYLMVSGGTSQPTAEYQERRAKLKNLECALASFELSSKAWHASTLEMGRTLDLLCDAFQSLHNVDKRHGDATPPSSTGDAVADRVPDVATSGDATTPQECPLYDEHNSNASSAEGIADALKTLKATAATAFRTFAVSTQQDVTGPLLSLTNEFRLCETLRHRRNRAQEQFDVDESVLIKKRADYEKKGKQLSESKKYADLVVQREQSSDALLEADHQFHQAYGALMDAVFVDTRRSMTRALATNSAALFGLLNERFAAVAGSMDVSVVLRSGGGEPAITETEQSSIPVRRREELTASAMEEDDAEATPQPRASKDSLDFEGIDPQGGATPPGTPSSGTHVMASGPPTDAV